MTSPPLAPVAAQYLASSQELHGFLAVGLPQSIREHLPYVFAGYLNCPECQLRDIYSPQFRGILAVRVDLGVEESLNSTCITGLSVANQEEFGI